MFGIHKKEDLEFLLDLDKKLHSLEITTITPNISGKPFDVGVDTYTDSSMEKEEVQKVLKVFKRNKFIFYPINTAQGFAVGFQVMNPETEMILLSFKESQLPKEYDFNSLSEHFMDYKNIERAERFEIRIIKDRSHYDY